MLDQFAAALTSVWAADFIGRSRRGARGPSARLHGFRWSIGDDAVDGHLIWPSDGTGTYGDQYVSRVIAYWLEGSEGDKLA